MNKFLVVACILLSLGLVYFKRKNDQYKKQLEKQQKLVDMLRAGIEKPLETTEEPESSSQLINLATSAISPLIAFIGPNLLKKKNSFLKESVNASDFELSEQLKQLDDDNEVARIVELPTTPLRVSIPDRLSQEAEAIAQEIQTFVDKHDPETAVDAPVNTFSSNSLEEELTDSPSAVVEASVDIEMSKKNKRKMKKLYSHPALDPCFGQESCPIIK